MPNIQGLIGYNKSSASVNKLLAGFGGDVLDVNTGLGNGLGLHSTNNMEFEVFLDRVFLQNYNDRPLTYNGTTFSYEYVNRTPISKYIKAYKEKSRLYLGNVKFSGPQAPLDASNNAIVFPSRVFYPDLFFGNALTWGIEWGTNAKTYANSNIVELDNPIAQNFKTSGIKVGDPLFFTNGNSALQTKPYFVASIPSEYRLVLTETLPVSSTGQHFWVGSNWFDVATDDSDQITGFGQNSTTFLIFKLLSLWRYNGNSLNQVKDSVGTSSSRSVISKSGYTYYFHGSDPLISGIYRFDGVSSQRISRAIDPFIRGMSPSAYGDPVAWSEGEEIRFYLGDISNSNYDISMTNAVATLNVNTNAWDVSPIQDIIKASATWRVSGEQKSYVGTSDSQVIKMSSGNSFNGAPINSVLETKAYYPAGTDVLNRWHHVQVIGRSLQGVRVKYKLWDKPDTVDDNWRSLGELSNDHTELAIPTDELSKGIQLRFENIGTLENDMYVEKYTIFYMPERTTNTDG